MNSGWPICDTQLQGLISGFTKPQSNCLGFINYRLLGGPKAKLSICAEEEVHSAFYVKWVPLVHLLLFLLFMTLQKLAENSMLAS